MPQAAVQSEPEFLKGWIEIQDEGSQLVALLSGAKPGEQVVDLCAGGGGKTLALAAMMVPMITRTTEEMVRLVPTALREAALALGYSRGRTALTVVLRTATAGIVTGVGRAGKIAVLSDGRNVMSGREGGEIDGRYRIVRIGEESIQLEYLDGRGRQTIRLSGQ